MAESTAAAAPLLTARFQRAFAVACEVHAAQLRKGTRIPYLAHVMSVAALVLEHGGGEDAAIGGLLHDAVEDSGDGARMEQRIRGEFGDHVAGIVMGCSDAVAVPGQPKPPWRDRKAAYLGRLAGEDDPDVLLVSACDKLHNAETLGSGRWRSRQEILDYFGDLKLVEPGLVPLAEWRPNPGAIRQPEAVNHGFLGGVARKG